MMNTTRYAATTATAALVAFLGSEPGFGQDAEPVDIPPQPLPSAIVELSQETGLRIMASNRLLEGKMSPGAQGSMDPIDALATILTGSGLTYRQLPNAGVVVTERNPWSQFASEDPFELDSIVLRGEIRDRTLEESPTSAVVVTGQELAETGGDVDLNDIIQRTPGVNSLGNGSFTVRGIRSRPVGGFGSQTINVQIDGVSLPNVRSVANGLYSTWDVEQVEILRGPQSTQQGRGALAGAIILRSNDPTFEQEAAMRGEVGSFEFRRGSMMVNTPLLDDKLAFRFSADVLETDGFIDNITRGGPSDPSDQETYRGKLLFAPTDRFEAVLSLTYNETFNGGVSGSQIAGDFYPDDFFNLSNQENREGAEQWIYGLRWAYDIADGLTLNSETTYLDADQERRGDFDGSAEDVPFLQTQQAFFRDSPLQTTVFEQDLSLSFETNRIQGTVGAFYTEIEEDVDPSSGDTFNFTGLVPQGVGTIQRAAAPGSVNTITNAALYGEADIFADEILTGLSFTLGARYDYEEFDNVTNVIWDPGFPPPVVQAEPRLADTSERVSGSFTAFLPKIGVNYDFNDSQRISLTYQQGYRAGGAVLNVLEEENAFDPEFTDNYELAYRGSFIDDRLRVRTNLFYTLWRDQQVSLNNGAGVVNIENAGESELYGLEFTVDADITDRLFLGGSVALVQTEFLEFARPDGSNFSGNEFPDAPPFTAQLAARYDFTESFSLGLSARYSDEAFGDAANSDDQISDSFFVADAQLTYRSRDDDWVAGLYVNNIFDEIYAITRTGPDSGGFGRLALETVEIGEPRTIGLFVQRNF